MNLNKRETATVLAALRQFQTIPEEAYPHFEDCAPLSPRQIDRLCERINTDVSPKVLRKPLGKRFKSLCNEDGYLTVIVPLDFDEMLSQDIEGLNDILDGLILGEYSSESLSDISWKVVGTSKEAILLEVTAKPEGID
jgi:hypothetical protein